MSERDRYIPEKAPQPIQEKMPKAMFNLGRVAITPGAVVTLQAAEHHPVQFLARHVSGDWGDLPEEDIEENHFALQRGLRVFSAYKLDTGSMIYVITEWDRSVTTLLLPEEY